MKHLILPLAIALMSVHVHAAEDTIFIDNGTASSGNQARAQWEESVILSPNAPCTLKKVLIYYTGGTGADTVRITGDASEGTIPPTQYCFSYNTLAKVEVNVTGPGWMEIDLTPYDVKLGGYDRVVVQHIMRTNGPTWAYDNGQSANITSYVYDPITPNPNFFNIPGIYYRANGDYLVRLVVDKPYTQQPPPTWTDVTDIMKIVDASGKRFRSDLVSVADINDDRWDDISIGNVVYLNGKGQAFTRRTLPFSATNVVWADVDGDGDLDAFAVNGNGNDKLFRNDSDLVFTDMTPNSGFVNDAPTVTPLWFDYDHDGDRDLFIANGRREVSGQETYFQDKLFRNDGNWKFKDVTQASGIAAGEPAPFYDTWGASLTDVNNDGWTDIFVATYRLAPDRLYINNKNGTFIESSQATGVIGIPTAAPGYSGHGMGSDWADVDNDGDIDLAIGNLGHPDQRGQYSNPSMILRNEGTTTTPSFKKWDGVTFREMNAGMCFGDFDLDGKVDLYHGQISYEGYGVGADRPARFYLQGASRMEDRTWETGLFIHGSWTGARIDFDNDGDIDLLAASGTHEVRLFRNDLVQKGNSLKLQVRSAGIESPRRAADGARVYVHTNAGVFMRQMPGTIIGGRCSQMSSDLHVGIGEATRIDSIIAIWPGDVRWKYKFFELLPNGAYVLYPEQALGACATCGSPRQVYPPQHAVGVDTRPTLRAVAQFPYMQFRIYDRPKELGGEPLFVLNTQKGEIAVPEDLELGKTYYWTVRYNVDAKEEPESGTWQFTVGAPQPRGTVITAPKQDEVVSNNTVVSWTRASYDSWQKPTVYYDFEIYRRTDRARVASVYNITDTTYTFTLEPDERYVAVVRAKSDTTFTWPWSEDRNFSTYSTVPGIALGSPANGATAIPIRPRFTWFKHEWADSGYVVQYDTLADFSTAIERRRNDSVLVITAALKPGRTYHWRVRGDNAAGMGAWSEVWTFTVSGTSSVEELGTSITTGLADRIEVYDVLGRLLVVGGPSDWTTIKTSISNLPHFVVTRSANGDVVERFLLPAR